MVVVAVVLVAVVMAVLVLIVAVLQIVAVVFLLYFVVVAAIFFLPRFLWGAPTAVAVLILLAMPVKTGFLMFLLLPRRAEKINKISIIIVRGTITAKQKCVLCCAGRN